MIEFNSLEIEKAWKRKRLKVYLNLYFYLSEHQELLKDEKIRIIFKDVLNIYKQYSDSHLSLDKKWVFPKWKVNEKEAKSFLSFITFLI